MLCTEKEAKKKFCVMVGANSQTDSIFCTASECMAWRWYDDFLGDCLCGIKIIKQKHQTKTYQTIFSAVR